jgi:hypothetical protein
MSRNAAGLTAVRPTTVAFSAAVTDAGADGKGLEELLGIELSGEDFPDLNNVTPGTNTWIARVKDGKPAEPPDKGRGGGDDWPDDSDP